MDDDDLRDLFAAFAMVSKMWMLGQEDVDAKRCYRMADAMIEAKYAVPEEVGIATAPKRKRKPKEEL